MKERGTRLLRWGALCAALLLCAASGALAEQDVHAGTQTLSGAALVELSTGADALPAGVRREGNTVTITAAGTYRLTGELEGRLVVDVGKKDEVTLALDGVRIVNRTESAVYVANAGMTTLLLPEGSASCVQSGEPAALDGSAVNADAEGGAIHAKDDLTVAGQGALFVGGYLNNGVHTSNRLDVLGGELTVEAVNNGVKGKDAVTVSGGTLRIVSGGDGITSDGEDGEGYGVVTVSGGAVEIVSAEDGMQAETLLDISGGELAVTAGGGSANAPVQADAGFGGRGGFGGMRGGRMGWDAAAQGLHDGRARLDGAQEPPEKPEGLPDMPDGTAPEKPEGLPDAQDGAMPDAAGFAPGAAVPEEEETEPDGAKGIKSGGTLRISGGAVTVDSQDDALHSDDGIEVTGGTLALSSGDDGMHADHSLVIDGGEIAVLTAYEGLEANQIAIGGGEISVNAQDDGVNANGGAQVSWGRRAPGDAQTAGGEMPNLLVTDGTLRVNAQGDGLDSNGNIYVGGGLVVVDGPSASGNGALDSGRESGGELRVNGGTVLAIGAAGMAETFDEESGQVSFKADFAQSVPAGSALTITAQDGTALFTHTAAKAFSSVVFSCGELAQGETVTVSAGEQSQEITLEGMSTSGGAAGRNRFQW